jgi:hypothetical protein
MFTFFIGFVSGTLALVRMTGHKSQSYQAVAHLWVGWLIGLWMFRGDALAGWTIVALSVIEVACFVWFKLHPPVTPQASLHPEQWRTIRRP